MRGKGHANSQQAPCPGRVSFKDQHPIRCESDKEEASLLCDHKDILGFWKIKLQRVLGCWQGCFTTKRAVLWAIWGMSEPSLRCTLAKHQQVLLGKHDPFLYWPICYSPVWIHMVCHSIVRSHKGPQNHSRTTSSICRWRNWSPDRLSIAPFDICGRAGCALHNLEAADSTGPVWVAPPGGVRFDRPTSFHCEEKMICCFERKMCTNFKYLWTEMI